MKQINILNAIKAAEDKSKIKINEAQKTADQIIREAKHYYDLKRVEAIKNANLIIKKSRIDLTDKIRKLKKETETQILNQRSKIKALTDKEMLELLREVLNDDI